MPTQRGEDPVSRTEILAWLSYEWAAAPFGNSILASYLAPYITGLVKECADKDGLVYLLFIPIHYRSFYQYCISLSVLCQLFLFIWLSGVADYGRNRKHYLVVFGLIGAISSCFLPLIVSEAWVLAGAFVVLSSVAFSSSFVLFNSYLPVLVRSLPDVVAASELENKNGDVELCSNMNCSRPKLRNGYDELCEAGNPVYNHVGAMTNELDVQTEMNPSSGDSIAVARKEETAVTIAEETNDSAIPEFPETESRNLFLVQRNWEARLSTYAVAVAFVAGLLSHIANLCVFMMLLSNPMMGFRVNIFLAAAWWILFMSVLVFLKPRPGPQRPATNVMCRGLKNTLHTMSQAKKLPYTFLFLLAYFLYSDGYSTTVTGASIFAVEELDLTLVELAILQLIIQVSAIIGSFFFLRLARRIGQKCTIIINMVGLSLPCVMALISLTTKVELFIVGTIFAFNIGAVQGLTRSLYSAIIPPGKEAEFFSFYAITDKGSSWLGPLLLGGVNQVTGSFRIGFFSLLIFYLLGGPILMGVDVRKARSQAVQFSALQGQ